MCANTRVFSRKPKGKMAQSTDCTNNAGGRAYALTPEGELAVYASTGTINDTYYIKAENQLKDVMEMCDKVSPEFLAKTAVYARQKGFMKDLPCVLLLKLLGRDQSLFRKIFPKVIDNVKMLRTFVQMLRSGQFGRKSFGSVVTKAVRGWFEGWKDANKLFNSSVGNNPSLGDIIRLAHPKPKTDEFSSLFGYLCGFPFKHECLPENVKRYELMKKNYAEGVTWDELPDINFQYLTTVQLTELNWMDIAKNASWQTTRMNLNTFARHGVFKHPSTVAMIAQRLKNKDEITKSKVFPYQLMMAYEQTADVPNAIRNSLQDAMEISIGNVPQIEGRVIVLVDSSGSMGSAVTGYRSGATSKVTCSMVAGLVGAAIKRMNQDAVIIAFDTAAAKLDINPRDSVMTNAKKMSRSGGGTDIGCGIRFINQNKIAGDMIVIVSDNESWFDGRKDGWNNATSAQEAWNTFEHNNKGAKCVCIDIQPNRTTQVKESHNVVNVAGFSDNVFTLLAEVAQGVQKDFFVHKINAIDLDDTFNKALKKD